MAAMKHVNPLIIPLLFLLVSFILYGCGMGDSSRTEIEERHKEADIMTIASLNGCPRCHRVKTSVVGPAWELVSERYKDAEISAIKPFLIDKVKKGGSGNWNDITAGATMPPHEGLVSDEHLERLIDYIISLKRLPE